MKVKRFLLFFLTVLLSFSYLPQIALAFENFTTWIEYDINSRISKSADTVSWIALDRNEEAMVYKDFGVNYFQSNFTISFEMANTGVGGGVASRGAYWAMSNLVADIYSLQQNSDYHLYLSYKVAGSNNERLELVESYNGTDYASNSYQITPSLPYFIDIMRNEEEGDFGILYAYIYNDEAKTNLVDTLSVALHAKIDLRYNFACLTRDTGESGLTYTGYVKNMDTARDSLLLPLVMTVYSQTVAGKVILGGYTNQEYGTITEKYFQIGTSSGNYTDNFTGIYVSGGNSWFTADLTSNDITAGQTYYFRAVASNANGTSYGSELSFLCYFEQVTLVATGVTIAEQPNGKWSAQMTYSVSPNNVDNAYIALSSTANFSDNITDVQYAGLTYERGSNTGWYSFRTYGSEGYGVLEPDTTYYYQGYIDFQGINYYSNVRAFTTGNTTALPPEKPVVQITSVKDVSQQYNGSYFFEFIAKVTTSNITDTFYEQGFSFSLQQNPSLGVLLPTVYTYKTNIDATNTFRLVVNLDNADWYTGQTLFIQAWVQGIYHGKIYSSIVSTTPISDTGDGDIDVDTTDTDITPIIDIINTTKAS